MNRLLIIVSFVLVFTLVLPGESLAQRKRQVVKDKKVDFDEEEILGQMKRPINAFVISRNKAQLPPLIKFREHFREELEESADNL